ncbi:MAG: asparagine synthase (glutamine-hydrolyzing) [Phenylobacterium sp.]
MCGIGGCVDFNRTPSKATLNAMARALGRRGPDEQGILVQGACGFAHARLSIIDVEGSHQPMRVPDRDLSLVYNGEIYNYQALRGELQAQGVSFATQGDTEVVLRWMDRAGPAALAKFDAMFAFALWDATKERLLLARDALGEKPLFYATPSPGVLVFGSEIKAILQHPAVDRGLNDAALRQALRFRAIYGAESLHAGVRQLEPGCWLEFDRAGVRTGRFYDLLDEVEAARARYSGWSDEKLVAGGRELFMDSVKGRLVADVPVGAFLSGGLDSSLIVAAMRQIRPAGAEIETFSVGFTDDPHSELPFAQEVAEAIGSRHTAIGVGPQSYIDRFAELSACRDGPVSQPADIAIAEMSKVARRTVKVALSGEGADEVFAGYPKYRFAGAPWALRRALALVGPQRAADLGGALGLDRRRALVAARALAAPTEVERQAQWFSYLGHADLAGLLPGLGWDAAAWARTIEGQTEALARLRGLTPLGRMQAIDCLTWLPGNMLERGDRMTMAEGLEVRPPFLSRELTAFGLVLPDRLKVRGSVGKHIVRTWAKDLLPAGIAGRGKWGFRVPLAAWFKGPMRDFLRGYLLDPNGLCATYGDLANVRRLIDLNEGGGADLGETLWTLLAAEVWFQTVYRPLSQPQKRAATA